MYDFVKIFLVPHCALRRANLCIRRTSWLLQVSKRRKSQFFILSPIQLYEYQDNPLFQTVMFIHEKIQSYYFFFIIFVGLEMLICILMKHSQVYHMESLSYLLPKQWKSQTSTEICEQNICLQKEFHGNWRWLEAIEIRVYWISSIYSDDYYDWQMIVFQVRYSQHVEGLKCLVNTI